MPPANNNANPMHKFSAIGEEAVDDMDSAGELYKVSKALKFTLAPHSANMPRSVIAIRLIKNRQKLIYTFSQMLLILLLGINQLIINTSKGSKAI